MKNKAELFTEFYDLLCEKFGGSSKMYTRFWQLCKEAGVKNVKSTNFGRLNRMEISILIEAIDTQTRRCLDARDTKDNP